jgi:two-component system cell cycle sensor histidine kinase PleC
VLQNIMRNAIKFTDAGGSVDVSVSRADDRVRIAVKDTGIGIPPDMLQTVGRPFVQVEGNLARKNSGIGLGLAIANALMRLMQGELLIESTPGAGTTVTICLPVDRGDDAHAEREAEAAGKATAAPLLQSTAA